MGANTFWTQDLAQSSETSDTTWATLWTRKEELDKHATLKLWAELKVKTGSGTVYLRLQVTDGTDTYNSDDGAVDPLSTTESSWAEVGPATLALSVTEDKVWTIRIQGKVASGLTLAVRGPVVHRL